MAETTGRSLACIAPERRDDEAGAQPGRHRADPRFLAHLIAVRARFPSQRAKRRAAPEEGAAAYREGLGLDRGPQPRRTVDTRA